jgi:zinc transporter ZupT
MVAAESQDDDKAIPSGLAGLLCVCSEKKARKHAVISAYLSILAGLLEVGLSLYVGHNEKSMSVYSIALMAIVDVSGSILVLSLWQFSGPAGLRLMSERKREMHYSVCIGAMMCFLAIFLLADSFQRLLKRATTKDTTWGIVDGIIGTCFGIGLAVYKWAVGKSLDSPVVIADAVSSFCGGMTSCLALLVVFVDDNFWWSDSTAGFTSALYTLYSGVSTVLTSNAELSKLNKLVRGGPRQAPDYIKKLANSATYQQEIVTAALVDGPLAEDVEYEEGRSSSRLGRFVNRLLGLRDPEATRAETKSLRKDGGTESQNLLPYPASASEDLGEA